MSALDSMEQSSSQPKFDLWLLATALLLAGVGILMVLSASGVVAERYFHDKYHFFRKQLIFGGLGLIILTVSAWMSLDRLYKFKYVALGGVGLLLLITKFTPLGVEINGARRWLRLGFMSVQPMEFAKIALVFYLAWFMSQKKDMVKTFTVGVVPPFAVTGALCGLLLLQPDFGGAVFICMLLFLMCLVGGTRSVYLFSSVALGLGAGWMLIINSPYRSRRLLAFLDPFKDAMNTGYQLVQSLYAFGTGSIWGVGLGGGKQKLFFLPEAHNDFIMAVVGEELGFMGVSLVFLLMGFLLWRCFNVALRQQDLRDRYTAYGLTLILALGAIMNMAVVLGSAPPKGVPMPFLSYGGSSMICSFFCVGLLLNLSRKRGGSFSMEH